MDDEEPPTLPRLRGYRRLADYMAWDPSKAIFSRFRAANALNLLGLQAEICRLQEELMDTTHDDEDNPEKEHVRKRYQYDWSSLQDGEDGNSRQKGIILQLRERLKDYNGALVQQIIINNQASPSIRELDSLKQFMEEINGLASDLRGPGCRVWFTTEGGEYKVENEVLIWHGNSGSDSFTQLITRALGAMVSFLPYLHVSKRTFPAFQLDELNRPAHRIKDFELYTSTGAIVKAGDNIVTVVSCFLITMPVIILNYVSNVGLRLGLIMVFSLVFSLALSFMSDATRKEVFAATAAFTAVQVVYVGGGG